MFAYHKALLALMHRAGCMTFQSWSVRSARRRTGLPLAPTMTSPRIPELRSTPRRPARVAASPRPCAGSPIPRRRARRDRFVGGHYADSRRRHASFADELRHHAVDDVHRDGKTDPGVRARRRESLAILAQRRRAIERQIDSDLRTGASANGTGRYR